MLLRRRRYRNFVLSHLAALSPNKEGASFKKVHHRRARVTSHCAPFSPMCASTYELHMPQCPRGGPNGSPKAPKMALYWLKVGPKWSQNRSVLRKTVQNCLILVKVRPKCSQSGSTLLKAVQNGSNPVKIGPQAAGWVPRWN